MKRDIRIFVDRAAVENAVAHAVVAEIRDAIAARGLADVVLTGGTVGIGTLVAMSQLPEDSTIDWSKVRVWWGDERYVPAGHSDRNDAQADAAVLSTLPFDPAHIFRFPASDSGLTLDEARQSFDATLRAAFDGEPRFDVVLCGIGPDGHVASLFPGHDHGAGHLVIAVSDSPKPPAERLSLTFAALNAGRHVWIVCAGADKAEAVARVMHNEPPAVTPATALHGIESTIVWADAAAAQHVSAD